MRTVFTACRLYTPLEEIESPWLEVEDGQVTAVSSRLGKEMPGNASLVDFGDAVLAPGFVDIHMHGGAGLDVMRAAPAELPIPRPSRPLRPPSCRGSASSWLHTVSLDISRPQWLPRSMPPARPWIG